MQKWCKENPSVVLCNPSDALESKDRFKEGLISRDDVQRIIEEQKINDLQPVEVNLLMKLADRGSKGYIVIDRFIERL